MYEVELKFPLADPGRAVEWLAAHGARCGELALQSDMYYRHPQRDFEKTDEALRIRSSSHECCLTYKGPVVDRLTKTRRELEVPFSTSSRPESAALLAEILERLGFASVRRVDKRRTPYHLDWRGRPFEVCLDEVAGLGLYLEIETLAPESARADAQRDVLALAEELQLGDSERRSYLCLLLEQDREQTGADKTEKN